MSRIARRIRSLFFDSFEKESVFWLWRVNRFAAGHLVSNSVRQLIYRSNGLVFGKGVSVRPGVYFRSRDIVIGKESAINIDVVFDNRSGVIIGERVGVGIGTLFLNTDHDTGDPDRRAGVGRHAPVKIEDGVFIGSRVIVFPGVVIGKGAVVGAGSVVTTSLESHGLYVGSPAKLVRKLGDSAPIDGLGSQSANTVN